MVLVLFVLVLSIEVRAVEVEEAVAELVAGDCFDSKVYHLVLLVIEGVETFT